MKRDLVHLSVMLNDSSPGLFYPFEKTTGRYLKRLYLENKTCDEFYLL